MVHMWTWNVQVGCEAWRELHDDETLAPLNLVHCVRAGTESEIRTLMPLLLRT